MKISTPTLANNSFSIQQISSAGLNHLKSLVGQTTSIQITHTHGSQVGIQVGQHHAQAYSQLNLTANSQLQVQVTEQSGKIRLTVLPTSPAETNTQNWLRQLIPNQTPLNQTLNFLTQPQIFSILPHTLQNMINNLIDQLFRPAQLNAKKLQHAIAQSGQFLENHLKQNQGQLLSKDIKAQLFQVQHQLNITPQTQTNPSLGHALKLVNQSIQAIQLNQIQQTEQPDNLISQIYSEHQHQIQAVKLIFKQPKQDAQQDREVLIILELDENRKLEAKIRMTQDDGFKIWLHTPSQAFEKTLTEQLTILKDGFEQAGLALNLLEISRQPLVKNEKIQPSNLINIKV